MSEEVICAACGRTDGRIQHVDIAWPVGQRWQGMHWSGWLHPGCEAAYVASLEKTFAPTEPGQ
jgi:hypothetical protein